MPRDCRQYLDDIICACNRIAEYTRSMTWDGFRTDNKTIDAVVRNLEIIGEATKALP